MNETRGPPDVVPVIGVAPVGGVSEIVTKVIAAHISGYLNLSAEILRPLDAPEYAFDRQRLQYNAAKILAGLESVCFFGFEKIIAVFNVDLFIPIFSHVFGEARQGGGVALVSLFRLGRQRDGATSPPAVVHERAAKVALHEIGHLFNLFHCDDTRCLMHFTGGVDDLDQTPLYFCKYCTTYFKDALRPIQGVHSGVSEKPPG